MEDDPLPLFLPRSESISNREDCIMNSYIILRPQGPDGVLAKTIVFERIGSEQKIMYLYNKRLTKESKRRAQIILSRIFIEIG